MRLPPREYYVQPKVKIKQIRELYALEREGKLNHLDVFQLTGKILRGLGKEVDVEIVKFQLIKKL